MKYIRHRTNSTKCRTFTRGRRLSRSESGTAVLPKATNGDGSRTCYTPRRSRSGVIPILPGSISDLQQRLADQHYVADRGLAVSVFLALRLKRPLFLGGEAGAGKTLLASAAAAARRPP